MDKHGGGHACKIRRWNSLMCVCGYWVMILYIYVFIYVSSPYLLMFDDDCVMIYTIADDVASGAGEA